MTISIVRAALYIRVSGEEQKIKGLSLEAQQERLEAYAKERGWVIAGIFIDAAKTARKNMHKRTEFQRMMETHSPSSIFTSTPQSAFTSLLFPSL